MTFDENVVVTGTPTLTLETGATDAVATYAGGSGTATLTFTYTVAAGQNSTDLDHVSTASLLASGGTIKDVAGNGAVLTLPAPGSPGSLGANASIIVDTTSPTFDAVSATMGSTTVTAWFSEPIACSTVTANDFTATVAGLPAAVTAAACAGPASATVALTVGSTLVGGATVAVSLVDTNGSVGDAAGNLAAVATRSVGITTDVTAVTGTADGATVVLGAVSYSVTATDDGTIVSLDVLLDGAAPAVNGPVCSGTGTVTATCAYVGNAPNSPSAGTSSRSSRQTTTGTRRR